MPRPKIPVEDRLEIQELFAYYAWGLNTGDADQVVACFTDDATFEHQPQGVFRGHDQLRVLLDHLWYAKPGWFIGRQHLANHFIMTPLGEQEMQLSPGGTTPRTPRGMSDGKATISDMHVKAYSSILQHNLDYRRNFVFGLASWDNVCTKASGEWLFKSVRIVKWMGDDVPWAGEERAKQQAPSGPLL